MSIHIPEMPITTMLIERTQTYAGMGDSELQTSSGTLGRSLYVVQTNDWENLKRAVVATARDGALSSQGCRFRADMTSEVSDYILGPSIRERIESGEVVYSPLTSRVGEVPILSGKRGGVYTAHIHVRDARLEALRSLPDVNVGIQSKYFHLNLQLQEGRIIADFSVIQSLLIAAGVIAEGQWQDAARHFSSQSGALVLHSSVEGLDVQIDMKGVEETSRVQEGGVVSAKQEFKKDNSFGAVVPIPVPPTIELTLRSAENTFMTAAQERSGEIMLVNMRTIAESWWPHARDVVGQKESY